MYLEHFGLSEAPFSLTPDTHFFISSGCHQEALNTLLIAIRNGEGFIKITGEVGTGKSLLCRKFLGSLDPGEFATAYLPNPQLDPQTLQFALADELKAPMGKRVNQHQLLRALTMHLMEIAKEGKSAVLCIDEAQAMPLETLEALRLLTNLETEKRKLLQVVLFGQPELDQKLSQESVRQINQRITFHYRLRFLTEEETRYYVNQRLSIAGYRGEEPFGSSAMRALYRASCGVPRLINILAHKSLMLAYGRGRHRVDAGMVDAAAADTPSMRQRQTGRWKWGIAAALSLAIAAGGIAWMMKA